MSKRVLMSLILVLVLLFTLALPAWAGYVAPSAASSSGFLLGPGRILPMGGCEDPGAGGCDYG